MPGNRNISCSEAVLDFKTALFWVINPEDGTDMLFRNVCKQLLHGRSLKSRIGLDLCGYSYIIAEGKTNFLL